MIASYLAGTMTTEIHHSCREYPIGVEIHITLACPNQQDIQAVNKPSEEVRKMNLTHWLKMALYDNFLDSEINGVNVDPYGADMTPLDATLAPEPCYLVVDIDGSAQNSGNSSEWIYCSLMP